jgi:hypothetical protein
MAWLWSIRQARVQLPIHVEMAAMDERNLPKT